MSTFKHKNRAHSNYPDENFEKIRSKYRHDTRESDDDTHSPRTRVMHDTHKFKCSHCGAWIVPDRADSGVNNRNHCPHCLWSLHVDEKTPGDRRSHCQSRMEPIGVTVKQSAKRYNRGAAGELMLIHRCLGCGKLSINRIAADDNAAVIHKVYKRSLGMSLEEHQAIEQAGISLLTERDVTTIFSQLYGWQSILEEFKPSDTVDGAVFTQSLMDEEVKK